MFWNSVKNRLWTFRHEKFRQSITIIVLSVYMPDWTLQKLNRTITVGGDKSKLPAACRRHIRRHCSNWCSTEIKSPWPRSYRRVCELTFLISVAGKTIRFRLGFYRIQLRHRVLFTVSSIGHLTARYSEAFSSVDTRLSTAPRVDTPPASRP